MLFERPVPGHLATLVSVRFTALERDDGDTHRDEFEELVRSAALVCVATVTASRDKPHPRWFLGTGKVDELADVVATTQTNVVVFNHELTPAQQRNLEERLACRVMTRTELILHIFADRARTHEGSLQVQLAQLTHAQTRLIRGWTHLDRQTGGGRRWRTRRWRTDRRGARSAALARRSWNSTNACSPVASARFAPGLPTCNVVARKAGAGARALKCRP